MDLSTIKAGLRSYKHIDEDIRQKLMFAEEVEAANGGQQYKAEAEELQRVKQEMIHTMNDLMTIERDCIWRHYVNGEMWVRIARRYNYSERQIRNIANVGLNHLGKLVSEREALQRYFLAAKKDFPH